MLRSTEVDVCDSEKAIAMLNELTARVAYIVTALGALGDNYFSLDPDISRLFQKK